MTANDSMALFQSHHHQYCVYTAGTVFTVIKEGTVVSGFYGLWI